ncbi:MAG: hypothetical protein M3Z30_03300, partial [Gemmatimonadota bacterium]|nr:hypothetical protein [Gemmatimonadota bacterium]
STHADSLRARLAATMPNVFRQTLALRDSLSLSLDSTQVARIRLLGDAYRTRADSLVNSITAAMSAPVAGTDPAAVATNVREKTGEANALQKKALADLRAVLRDDQLKKLPQTLIGPDLRPH